MLLIILAGFLIAAAWMGLVALGVMIIWRGCRGRLVDRILRCEACGYALVGARLLPPVCSECGAVIAGPHDYRPGPRQRRWPLIAGGAAIVLLCLVPVALALAPVSSGSRPAAAAAAAAKPAVQPAVQLPGAGTAATAARAASVPSTPHSAGAGPCPACGAIHGTGDLGFRRAARPRAADAPPTLLPDMGSSRVLATSEPLVAPPTPAPVATPTAAHAAPHGRLFRHLRNVNGCCPHCGYPVLTPSERTRCGRCGVDLEDRTRPPVAAPVGSGDL